MFDFLSSVDYWIAVAVCAVFTCVREILMVNEKYYGIRGSKYMEILTFLFLALILTYVWIVWQHGWIAPIVAYAVCFVLAIPAGNIAHRGKR